MKKRRKDFADETVLIAIPTDESKLFCFPSMVQCLKDLLATTNAKCAIAFATNSEDTGMVEAISQCGLPHVTVRAERTDELPPEIMDGIMDGAEHIEVVEYNLGQAAWIGDIARARNALREHAVVNGYDWLFFLDSDTAIEPKGLNRLLSYGSDMASAFVRLRGAVEHGDQDYVNFIGQHGKGISTEWVFVPHSEVVNLPAPIAPAFPGLAAGLIHRRVFGNLEFRCGFVPLSHGETPGRHNCFRAGRFASEDTMFALETAQQGFTSALDHSIRSVHFIDEQYDYPRGSSNKMVLKSYEEIRR